MSKMFPADQFRYQAPADKFRSLGGVSQFRAQGVNTSYAIVPAGEPILLLVDVRRNLFTFGDADGNEWKAPGSLYDAVREFVDDLHNGQHPMGYTWDDLTEFVLVGRFGKGPSMTVHGPVPPDNSWFWVHTMHRLKYGQVLPETFEQRFTFMELLIAEYECFESECTIFAVSGGDDPGAIQTILAGWKKDGVASVVYHRLFGVYDVSKVYDCNATEILL